MMRRTWIWLVAAGCVVLAACDSATNSEADRERCPKGASCAAPRSRAIEGDTTTTARNDGRVEIRLALSKRVTKRGTTMNAVVHVQNRTGRAIPYTYCLSPFQVALGRPGAWPDPVWATCASRGTLAPGATDFPVTVTATVLSCSGMPTPPPDMPKCGPAGRLPALTPGAYYARVYQGPRLGIAPKPIRVRVVR